MREAYRDDLRRLRDEAGRDPARIRGLLADFPRVGPVGVGIFCREVQAVWPELRPALDGRALDGRALAGARAVGLPDSEADLAALVDGDDLAHLAAALVRVALDRDLAEQVRAA
ncbi:MAG: hypothetical protein AB7J32_16790 [Pseudonocardia sp.]